MIGGGSGNKVNTGSNNTCVGNSSCPGISTAGETVALGALAGGPSMGGSGNTLLGYQTGYVLTSGASNTIIGDRVGRTSLATGSGNILIGTSAAVDTPAAGTSNYLDIGNLLVGDTAKGIFNVRGTAPTLSACGTGPSVDANAGNASGTVTVGSSAASGCTISFASAFSAAPHCTVTARSGLGVQYAPSASAIVVANTNLSGAVLDYVCLGGSSTP